LNNVANMIGAQLIACHNASMDCYRLAMPGEQTFEGWRENLNQANKLSRTRAVLLDALNRHRGKGHQKVTVEHVHVYEVRVRDVDRTIRAAPAMLSPTRRHRPAVAAAGCSFRNLISTTSRDAIPGTMQAMLPPRYSDGVCKHHR
jgi:hypothetical protein